MKSLRRLDLGRRCRRMTWSFQRDTTSTWTNPKRSPRGRACGGTMVPWTHLDPDEIPWSWGRCSLELPRNQKNCCSFGEPSHLLHSCIEILLYLPSHMQHPWLPYPSSALPQHSLPPFGTLQSWRSWGVSFPWLISWRRRLRRGDLKNWWRFERNMPHFHGIVIGHYGWDTHILISITGWDRCLCVGSFGALSECIILYIRNYIYIIIYYPHLSANLMVPNNFPIFNIAIFWAIIAIANFLDQPISGETCWSRYSGCRWQSTGPRPAKVAVQQPRVEKAARCAWWKRFQKISAVVPHSSTSPMAGWMKWLERFWASFWDFLWPWLKYIEMMEHG